MSVRSGFSFLLSLVLALLLGCGNSGGGGGDSVFPSFAVAPGVLYVLVGSNVDFVAMADGTPTQEEISWFVDGVEGGNEERGVIVDGVYAAPASLPVNPGLDPANPLMVSVKAVRVETGEFAETSFSLAALTVSLSPKQTNVGVGETVQFTVAVEAVPNEEQLRRVEWLVNGKVGGGDETGTIDNGGSYTAPSAVPDPSTVTVTVRSVLFPDVKAEAEATVIAVSANEVSISPRPVMVGVKGDVSFAADVPGTPNDSVVWFVNGVQGGDYNVGVIDEDGNYYAPTDLLGIDSEVEIKAESTLFPGLSGSVSFPLVELSVSPEQIKSRTPGEETAVVATARYSDGSNEDITNLASTKFDFPCPSIAEQGTGKTVKIGSGAGVCNAVVTDNRPDGAMPEAAVEVVNMPNYTMELEPANLRDIILGNRTPLSVYLVADRGPEVGNKLDVVGSDTVSITALDSGGLVVEKGELINALPENYTAYVDRNTGEVVTGAKYGETVFKIEESQSTASAELTVTLLETKLTAEVRYNTSSSIAPVSTYSGLYLDQCDDSLPCAEPNYVYLIATPEGAGTPNEAAHLNVLVEIPGAASAQELEEFMGHFDVKLSDETGNGLFSEADRNFLPGCDRYEVLVPSQDFTPLFSNGTMVVGPLLQETFDSPYCQPFDDHVFATGYYYPSKLGINTVKATLSGISKLDGISGPEATVSVMGRLPQLALKDYAPGDSSYCADKYCRQEAGAYTFLVNGLYPKQGNTLQQEPSNGFTLVLKGTDPDGAAISEDDWAFSKRYGYNYGSYWYSLVDLTYLFRKTGDYALWLETEEFPGQMLGEVFTASIVDKAAGGWGPAGAASLDKAMQVDFQSTLKELTTASGTISVTLYDETGSPIDNQPLSYSQTQNGTCTTGKTAFLTVEAGALNNISGQTGSAWNEDDSTIIIRCDFNDPSMGEVKVSLLEGAPLGGFWTPLDGSSTVKIGVQTITPFHPACDYELGFRYDYYSYVVNQATGNCDTTYLTASSGNKSYFHGASAVLTPDLLIFPNALDGTVSPAASATITGEIAEKMISLGLPAPGGFSFLTADRSQTAAYLSVTGVEQLGSKAVRLTITADPGNLASVPAGYFLVYSGAAGQLDASVGAAVVKIQKSYADASPIPPLPLNGSRVYQPKASSMFQAIAELPSGSAFHNRLVELSTSSSVDSAAFKLAGFRRVKTTSQAGDVYEISTDAKIMLGPGSPSATMILYGNMTDLKLNSDPNSDNDQFPDHLPDVVSGYENDIEIAYVDSFTGTKTALAQTTAFNFEAERPGPLRKKELLIDQNTSFFDSLSKAETRLDWERLGWQPSISECKPMTNISQTDPERDVFVHVDNLSGDPYGLGDDGVGVLDMKFLDAELPISDGRAHDFYGVESIGAPQTTQVGTGSGWQYFGVELDGLCFDPGLGNDVLPNSLDLFAFASDTYTLERSDLGFIPGEGGVSGGYYSPDNGAFEIASRTPGVDFPGLDCGYAAVGNLDEWSTKGYDDYENAAVKSLLGDTHAFPYFPEAVYTFGKKRDGKEMLFTGFQTRGGNSGFIVTTNPKKQSGGPLVNAKLSSKVLIGEWPSEYYEEDGMVLTARVDGETLAQSRIRSYAIPAAMAFATGWGGVAIEGETGRLAGAAINVGVSLASSLLDDFGITHLNKEEGALMGSFASKQASKLVKSALRSGAGSLGRKELLEQGVNKGLFKSSKLNSSAAFGADAMGGFFATLITQELNDYFERNNAGNAKAFLLDQLWVSIPPEAVPQGSSGIATFMVGDVKMQELSALDKVDDKKGISQYPDKGESDAYKKKQGKTTRPLILEIEPNAIPTSTSGATSGNVCSEGVIDGQDIVADFTLQVGGDAPTKVSYVRTSLAGVGRNAEEGTAAVRKLSPAVNMFLIDPVIVEELP